MFGGTAEDLRAQRRPRTGPAGGRAHTTSETAGATTPPATAGRRWSARARQRASVAARSVGLAGLLVAVAGGLAIPAAPQAAADGGSDELATRAAYAVTALQQRAAATDAATAASTTERYKELRQQLAAAVAARAAVSAEELDAAWARAGDQRMTAVYDALTQVGVPYRFAASEPGVAFDCSGLTSWAWGQAGVNLEHSSYDQLGAATSRDESVAMAGDLTGLARRGHVAIYLGIDDLVVHAPNTGSLVRVERLKDRLAWFAYPAG